MKKKIFFITILCLIAMICAGTGHADDRQTAETLLRETFDAYINFTYGAFSSLVSDSFIPDRLVFLNRTQQRAYSEKVTDLDFFINKVVRNDKGLSVVFKWEKRAAAYGTGALRLTTGNARFVYVMENDRWRLYQVRGAPPI